MAQITITLPSLLHHVINQSEVVVDADTIRECLDHLVETYPKMKVHLFQEDGQLRTHVNILYQGQNLKWFENWNIKVNQGDELHILQAVSGG